MFEFRLCLVSICFYWYYYFRLFGSITWVLGTGDSTWVGWCSWLLGVWLTCLLALRFRLTLDIRSVITLACIGVLLGFVLLWWAVLRLVVIALLGVFFVCFFGLV